jgi:MtN3 and saliva related transmembrane protein
MENQGIFVHILATAALLSSVIGLLPQVYKAFKTKSAKDVSLFMAVNYFLGSLCWVSYGFSIGSFVVIVSNVAMFVASGILIFQKNYYDGDRVSIIRK